MQHEDGNVMSVERTRHADDDESGGGKSSVVNGTPTPRRFLRRGEGELMRMRSLENARRKKEMKCNSFLSPTDYWDYCISPTDD